MKKLMIAALGTCVLTGSVAVVRGDELSSPADCPACVERGPLPAEGTSAFFSRLFDTSSFPDRWHCGSWPEDLGWLHIVSDLAIFGAYFAIPVVLLYFLMRRKDVPFPRIVWLFATFILACGTGHLIEAGIFWWPAYRFAGLAKLFTATVSWITVLALVRVVPQVLHLPSAALLGQELQKHRDRLDLALAAGQIGVWDWNLHSHKFVCDQRSQEILGLDQPENDWSRDAFLCRLHPRDQVRVGRLLHDSMQDGQPFSMQFRLLQPDQSLRHVQIQGRVLLSRMGQPEQLVGVCQDFTEQERRREALQASEQRFRSTFEEVAIGVAHVAFDGGWLEVNRGLCDLLGYSEEELLQTNFQALTHPDDLRPDLDLVASLLAGNIAWYTMEKRYIRKDGSLIWANLTVSLNRDETGTPRHFISVVENIQRRKADEAALQLSHEQVRKLSLVASKTQHSVVICDAQGRIEWVNDAFTRLTGYTPEEAAGRKPGAFLQGPETDQECVQRIREALRRRESIATELVNYHKSGRKYWIMLQIDPVFAETGELVHSIATQTDITERKQTEARLLQHDAQFQSLFGADIIGILTCRSDSTVAEANDEFLRMIGYSRAELVNGQLNLQSLTPSEWRLVDTEALTIMRERGTAKPWEKEFFHRNGSRVPILLGMTPLQDREDHYLCFVLDITNQKKVESALKAAKLAADEANRAKSDFLANMSHEIRTPLNGILGFTDLLRMSDAPTVDTDAYLDTIHSSGRHLLTLINDILDLSKIEAGRMELNRVPCSPHGLIGEVLSMLRVQALEKRLALEYEWQGQVPETVLSDPGRLRQLLTNLVGNAIKFTDRGRVKLVARVDFDQTNPWLLLEVHDTGRGIAPEQLERIFEPFVQADTSITREFGGTGLGLSICRRIVESLGGELTVESRVGFGSVFRVCITTGSLAGVAIRPVPPPEAFGFQRLPSERSLPTNLPTNLPTGRVLLVEDGETNRRFISLVLTRAGVDVVCAENGQIGLDLAARERFDMILMDMQMPILDGYTATRRLRQQGMTMPVLALTAHAMQGDEEKCLAAGCSAYLSKPIDTRQLLRTVQKFLLDRPAREQGLTVEPVQPEFAVEEPIVSTLPVDDDDFRQIASDFLQTLLLQLEQMRGARQAGNYTELTQLAHWAKGTGGTAGFECVTTAARQLERASRSSDPGETTRWITVIESLARRISIPDPA